MKAPYRFVPLNKKVVYPEWADEVSFENPLEDSLKGEIKIKIKALKPIFIRDSNDEKKFFNINGEYYIPGSSFKGMLRNLIEVITYSKLSLEDKTLAYRDLRNPAYKKNAMNTNKIYHGWLRKENNKWVIDSLGKINNKKSLRIKYTELKGALEENVINRIKRSKKAWEKYRAVNNELINIENKGYLVFTGSTGNKSREFIFTNQIERKYVLSDHVVNLFKESYYIDNPSLINEDWKNLWGRKFENGEKVPVFFQLDEKGNIKHFGLSMLYKLPYKYSIKELLKKYQDYKDIPDFAQTLFGYVEESEALRGRVWVSHMKAKNVNEHPLVKLVLATPRPTFYPFYLKQDKQANRFKTYDDGDAVLSGFKFYPHRSNVETYSNICNQNANVCTEFFPLNSGTEFEGVIRFFNINEIELGAILSALTFFALKDNYAHKIGMAKPYGYGSIKIEIEYNNKEQFIKKFIDFMKKELNVDYLNEKRIKEFLKIHKIGAFRDSELEYNELKDFANIKKSKSSNNYHKNRRNQRGFNKRHR